MGHVSRECQCRLVHLYIILDTHCKPWNDDVAADPDNTPIIAMMRPENMQRLYPGGILPEHQYIKELMKRKVDM